MNIERKHTWISNGQRVLKLHNSKILPKGSNDDDREVIPILKAMKPFSTGGPSGIIITEVLKPNDR